MEKQSRAIENFKEMVIKAAEDRLKRPLTAAERGRIETDIAAKSHILSRTPNHPPYAAMIYEAIQELNNESGLSEESISNFMRAKYPDLPYHHSSCLKLNLQKLCDRKELHTTPEKCYILSQNSLQLTPPDQIPGVSEVQNHLQKQCDKKELHMAPEKCDILAHNSPKQTPPDQIMGEIKVQNQPENEIVVLEEENEEIGEETGKTEKRSRGRGRGRGNKQKPKEASTSDLILGLTRKDSHREPEHVRTRGRGRSRKLE